MNDGIITDQSVFLLGEGDRERATENINLIKVQSIYVV
jgi:hypothetical protein